MTTESRLTGTRWAEARDYLRQANAAALSKIPEQKPSILRRLLPWVREEDD